MDQNVVGTLCIFSFLVGVATQAPAAPPAENKGIKTVDPGTPFTGQETFTIYLHYGSGLELPSWNFTTDTPGTKIERIIGHLKIVGGHGNEGAHAGGHAGHASHSREMTGTLRPIQGYFGLEVDHYEPGVVGSHTFNIGACDFPQLEFSILQYTFPPKEVKDLQSRINGILAKCLRDSKRATSKTSQTRQASDGHTDHKH